MIIRKRPIISWLLNIDNMEDEGKFGVPMLSNKQHFGYLANGLKFLSDVRQTQPDWGLPELLMPSFEEVMKKSAKSFYGIDHQLSKNFTRTMSVAYSFPETAERLFMDSEKHIVCVVV
mgnify:CR=1 FL=1